VLAASQKPDPQIIPCHSEDLGDVVLAVSRLCERQFADRRWGSRQIEALSKRALDGCTGDTHAFSRLDDGLEVCTSCVAIQGLPPDLLGAGDHAANFVVWQSHGNGSDLAEDFDEKATPARNVLAGNTDCARTGVAALQHPGREPRLDLGREVAHQFSTVPVDPDARLVIDGRTRQKQQFVTGTHGFELSATLAENGAVNGRSKAGWGLRRQRRRYTRVHVG
jgi:hypothetical protein